MPSVLYYRRMQKQIVRLLQYVLGGMASLLLGVAFADFQVQPQTLPLSDYSRSLTASTNTQAAPKQQVANLWDILRDDFSLPDYSYKPTVAAQIYWYQKHPRYFEQIAANAKPYLYYIYIQAKKRQLPAETILLPIIESNYDPFAYSHVGAAGLWQLMPDTAQHFGLHRNYWYDQRRDILSSTNVALNYLEYLGEFFDHDWLLAMAAYNSGEGTVLNAVEAKHRRNEGASFWQVNLPQQTRAYVPKLLAVVEIVKHPDRYGFKLPYIPATTYLSVTNIDSRMSLSSLAKLAGISTKAFYQLNPGYNRFATGPKGPYQIILPLSHLKQFLQNLQHYKNDLSQTYTVKAGDSLTMIAKRFEVEVKSLQTANHLDNSNIRIGQALKIPKRDLIHGARLTAQVSKSRQAIDAKYRHQTYLWSTLASDKTLNYRVDVGDTLSAIAKKFGTTVAAIQDINGVDPTALRVGQQLIIPQKHAIQHARYVNNHRYHYYAVRAGDSLSHIAKLFGISLRDLELWNHLPSNAILHPGQQLIVFKAK